MGKVEGGIFTTKDAIHDLFDAINGLLRAIALYPVMIALSITIFVALMRGLEGFSQGVGFWGGSSVALYTGCSAIAEGALAILVLVLVGSLIGYPRNIVLDFIQIIPNFMALIVFLSWVGYWVSWSHSKGIGFWDFADNMDVDQTFQIIKWMVLFLGLALLAGLCMALTPRPRKKRQ